jgi:hypothetical protein
LSMRVMVSTPSDDLTALLTHFDMVWGTKWENWDFGAEQGLETDVETWKLLHGSYRMDYTVSQTFVGFCPPPLNNQEGFGKIPCWTGTMPTQLYSDFGHNVLNNCVWVSGFLFASFRKISLLKNNALV